MLIVACDPMLIVDGRPADASGFTDTEKRKYKKVWTHQRVAARKCFEM